MHLKKAQTLLALTISTQIHYTCFVCFELHKNGMGVVVNGL